MIGLGRGECPLKHGIVRYIKFKGGSNGHLNICLPGNLIQVVISESFHQSPTWRVAVPVGSSTKFQRANRYRIMSCPTLDPTVIMQDSSQESHRLWRFCQGDRSTPEIWVWSIPFENQGILLISDIFSNPQLGVDEFIPPKFLQKQSEFGPLVGCHESLFLLEKEGIFSKVTFRGKISLQKKNLDFCVPQKPADSPPQPKKIYKNAKIEPGVACLHVFFRAFPPPRIPSQKKGNTTNPPTPNTFRSRLRLKDQRMRDHWTTLLPHLFHHGFTQLQYWICGPQACSLFSSKPGFVGG